MKARIKGTNEIVEVLGLGINGKFLKCKFSDERIDMISPESLVEINKRTFDWQSFRAEAAKDILCAVLPKIEIIDGDFQQSIENAINNSIDVADELIKKLKEKEEKQ